jgi:DNA-directed RNA polymerase specialized sigma24 family protein
MKRWLAQVVASTRLRGEEPRTRFARQPARWFPPTPPVPESLFQDASEPFPRHWRKFPAPWARVDPADPHVRDALAAAIEALPETWREVIIARDGLGQDAVEVSKRLGLTLRQQRAILNRARASVRERLGRRLTPEAEG